MGTYIIHFDDKPWEDLDDELYYRCFEIPWFSTTKTTISRLTPYAEDSAYAHGYTEAESKYREIRNELEKQAYQRGYEEAYDTAYADAEGIYESGKRAMYQKGLKDAWDAARKIAHCFLWGKYQKETGRSSVCAQDVLEYYSAQEAIEEIRAHEQAQKEKEEQEKIKVVDEVRSIHHGWTAVVSAIDRECMTLMDANGELGDGYDVNRFTKTGRHFPEIAEVLQKMKETDNG